MESQRQRILYVILFMLQGAICGFVFSISPRFVHGETFLSPAAFVLIGLVSGAFLGIVLTAFFGGTPMGPTASLLARISSVGADTKGNGAWLLPFRRQFRDVVRRRPLKALLHLAEGSLDPAEQRLAIWLLGRCRGQFGLETLEALRPGAPLSIRREITRALKRKEAWSVLRLIEQTEPDPRIRRLAGQPEVKSYSGRVDKFLRNTAAQPVSASRQPLFIDERVDPRAGKPPKPPSLIRRLLQHIRSLVHGSP